MHFVAALVRGAFYRYHFFDRVRCSGTAIELYFNGSNVFFSSCTDLVLFKCPISNYQRHHEGQQALGSREVHCLVSSQGFPQEISCHLSTSPLSPTYHRSAEVLVAAKDWGSAKYESTDTIYPLSRACRSGAIRST